MNTNIIKEANITNKPFTKIQIDYFSNRIRRLTESKKQILESEYESSIQKESTDNYNKFIDTLGIKQLVNDFKTAQSSYDKINNSLDQLENKQRLEMKALKDKQALEYGTHKKDLMLTSDNLDKSKSLLKESLNKWDDIRKWNIYHFDLRDVADLESDLRTACYKETKNAFYKSTAGNELQKIDDVHTNILDHIYSNNLDKNILDVIATNLNSIGIKTQLQITN